MILWLGLALLLCCSGAVSGSETALFALDRPTLHAFSESSSVLCRRAARLMRHPRRVLMTVLIANTALNVTIFGVSFVTLAGLDDVHRFAPAVGGACVLFAVILGGEILPKAIAFSFVRRFAPPAALLISTLQIALGPIQWLLATFLVNPITRLISPQLSAADAVTTEELRLLVEQSAMEGVISSRENEMLQGAVALGEASVREVMTPRVDIQYVRSSASRADASRIMRESGRRKLPVVGRDLDDIRGILHGRDLFLQVTTPIHQLLRPVHYVPEQIRLVQLIRHFREHKIQHALVVDEYGGTVGLVSMEDVVERIVGDLSEYDAPVAMPTAERIDENTYRLSGDLSVRDWADRFAVARIDRRITTIGGLVLARLGRLPRVGDTVRMRNLTLTVESMDKRRVLSVLLERDDADQNDSRSPG